MKEIICSVEIKSQVGDTLIVIDVADKIGAIVIMAKIGSSCGSAFIERCEFFFIDVGIHSRMVSIIRNVNQVVEDSRIQYVITSYNDMWEVIYFIIHRRLRRHPCLTMIDINDMIFLVVSLFLLRSNNSTTRTSQ